jgi:hypothetical protein
MLAKSKEKDLHVDLRSVRCISSPLPSSVPVNSFPSLHVHAIATSWGLSCRWWYHDVGDYMIIVNEIREKKKKKIYLGSSRFEPLLLFFL